MSESLLIYIPSIGTDRAEWVITNERGLAFNKAQQTSLADAAKNAGGRQVKVVVASEDILLTEVDVPVNNMAQAQKAIPYALEDNLASEVANLHFAIGKRTLENRYPVAIINRTQMSALQAQLDQAGLQPVSITPEALSIPTGDEPDSWSAMLTDERAVLRQGMSRGFSCDSDIFTMLLNRAVDEAEDHPPTQLNLYLANNGQKPDISLPTVISGVDDMDVLQVFSLNPTSGINLLQGDYSRKKQFGKLLKPWKASAVLLLLLLSIWGISSVFEYIQLGHESERLDQNMVTLYRQIFPTAKNVADPVRFMRQKMQTANRQGVDFLDILATVSKAIKADKELQLTSINFREGNTDLSIEASKLALLDAFKQRIEVGDKLKVTIQSANQQNNRVRGNVRIVSR